jgi:hypothetical protein
MAPLIRSIKKQCTVFLNVTLGAPCYDLSNIARVSIGGTGGEDPPYESSMAAEE